MHRTTTPNDPEQVDATPSHDDRPADVHINLEFVSEVHERIEALKSLEPNWDGYGAPEIDPRILDAAKQFISRLPENIAYRAHVVPTANGSLQLEWHEGPKSLELEFESPTTIRFLQWNPLQGVELEDTFPVADVDRAADLIRWFMMGS